MIHPGSSSIITQWGVRANYSRPRKQYPKLVYMLSTSTSIQLQM